MAEQKALPHRDDSSIEKSDWCRITHTHPEQKPGEVFLGIAKDPSSDELNFGGTTVEMYGEHTRCGVHAYDSDGTVIKGWVPVFRVSNDSSAKN